MKIGVFDSGVGGLSVANAIKKALPEYEVILREDRQHVPYGNRQPAELLNLVTPIFQELVDHGCQTIVIACNTVSTTIADELRIRFAGITLVTMEPMIAAAAERTKSRVIAVCATPTTLASSRYQQLLADYAKGVTVLEPDCSDWAYMIEHREIDQQNIAARVEQILQAGADVIVLGCTHYHWIEQEITALAEGRAAVLQPEQHTIRELKQALVQLT